MGLPFLKELWGKCSRQCEQKYNLLYNTPSMFDFGVFHYSSEQKLIYSLFEYQLESLECAKQNSYQRSEKCDM